MEPREQRAIEFTLGAGKVKKGRNYNSLPNAGTTAAADPNIMKADLKFARDIQSFLKSRGYAVTVDGDWGAGSKRALKAFQENQNLKATGEWDPESQAAIENIRGVATGLTVENVKDEQGRTRITVFAVVDPYNLIDESNERNNIVTYTGYLACD
jgi:peptidoglycan hydrolase-like protein with peptidoglycan-binding domain